MDGQVFETNADPNLALNAALFNDGREGRLMKRVLLTAATKGNAMRGMERRSGHLRHPKGHAGPDYYNT